MPDDAALRRLLTPEAVRERADELYALGLDDRLPHFRLHTARLEAAADLVADMTRATYPDLAVPLHSRWRHFELAGHDLAAEALAGFAGEALLHARVRLAVVSVLLDAGAGADWAYVDAGTGLRLGRSEGLALASLRAFEAGAFTDEPLKDIDAPTLARLFQAGPGNPLLGLEGRVHLLNALGRSGALGRIADVLAASAVEPELPAREILLAVLDALNPLWPSGLVVEGVALGDVGRHSALRRDDASDRLVPFHKLSQWLAYSLVEPLLQAGCKVTGLDGLTGLAEYRNGGLFLDMGVLVPRDPGLAERRLAATDEPVVEWRALTVALLDRIAGPVRQRLGVDAAALPLGAILQGGTWAAGRRLAQERRGGRPPLDIASDGTVF